MTKQETASTSAQPTDFYAMIRGESESIVWSYPTRGAARAALLACYGPGDLDDGDIIETGEFLEDVAPRLLREEGHRLGVPAEQMATLSSWLEGTLTKILEPIRNASEELPWARCDIQEMTVREARTAFALPTD